MKQLVGLTYDLRDDYLSAGLEIHQVAEFDSAQTLDAIEQAIISLGYRTDRIGNGPALARRLVDGDRWDMVFNIAEGLSGRSRESQVPCLLEMFNQPYTFSDPLTCAATLDKAVAKRLVRSAGLATPDFAIVRSASDIARVNLTFPLFAKPLAEGTGKGIDTQSRIESPSQLREICNRLLEVYDQPVLVEQYLPGREFTVAIIGWGNESTVLGSLEIVLNSPAHKSIYSYDAKERCEELVTYKPPGDSVRAPVERLALEAYIALDCRDAGRVDIRCDRSGAPSFMELNPLPGMHPTHSDLPMIATQQGLAYQQLIAAILDSAFARSSRQGKSTKLMT